VEHDLSWPFPIRKGLLVSLERNQALWMYMNSSTPHAIRVKRKDNSPVVTSPQPYVVCPPQHWITGELDETGSIIRSFTVPDENDLTEKFTHLKVQVEPLMNHTVEFSSSHKYKNGIPSNWSLYHTPSQVNLSVGDSLFMSSDYNFHSNPNPKSATISKNRKITIFNRSLSRKHVLLFEQNTSVRTIKENLEALSNFPMSSFSLFSDGRLLAEEDLLSEYCKADDPILLWEIDKRSIEYPDKFPHNHEVVPGESQIIFQDDRSTHSWDSSRGGNLNVLLVNINYLKKIIPCASRTKKRNNVGTGQKIPE